MNGEMDDRVAVVTGGTGALGRAVVEELLDAGARVHVPWIDEEEAEALRKGIRGHSPSREDALRMRPADVTDAASVDEFFATVRQEDGDAGILMNLVGGFALAPLEETTPSTWEGMLALNATSAFLCSRAALPGMRRLGRGRIVNVAALPALNRGAARMSAYGASKAAVLNLTHSLARELRPDGITVNAVAPSIIDTPANRAGMPDADTSGWLAPAEIAKVIRFLASDDAAVVTGSTLELGRG